MGVGQAGTGRPGGVHRAREPPSWWGGNHTVGLERSRYIFALTYPESLKPRRINLLSRAQLSLPWSHHFYNLSDTKLSHIKPLPSWMSLFLAYPIKIRSQFVRYIFKLPLNSYRKRVHSTYLCSLFFPHILALTSQLHAGASAQGCICSRGLGRKGAPAGPAIPTPAHSPSALGSPEIPLWSQ